MPTNPTINEIFAKYPEKCIDLPVDCSVSGWPEARAERPSTRLSGLQKRICREKGWKNLGVNGHPGRETTAEEVIGCINRREFSYKFGDRCGQAMAGPLLNVVKRCVKADTRFATRLLDTEVLDFALVWEFWHWLTRTFPLPAGRRKSLTRAVLLDVEATVRNSNRSQAERFKHASGLTWKDQNGDLYIAAAIRGWSTLDIMNALAHEYKHCIQWNIQELKPGRMQHENPAEVFGAYALGLWLAHEKGVVVEWQEEDPAEAAATMEKIRAIAAGASLSDFT